MGGPSEISPPWCLTTQVGSSMVAVVVDCRGEPAPAASVFPPTTGSRSGDVDPGSRELLARAVGQSELEELGPRHHIKEGEGSPPVPWRDAG